MRTSRCVCRMWTTKRTRYAKQRSVTVCDLLPPVLFRFLPAVATDQSDDKSPHSKFVDATKGRAPRSKVLASVCLLPASCFLLPAYCLLFIGLGTRDRGWALSTLNDAHRAHRLFLIGGNG